MAKAGVIEMNVYESSHADGEPDINLGDKWARRNSVLLDNGPSDASVLISGDFETVGEAGSKALPAPASKVDGTSRPVYRHPAFIGAVIIIALVAIIVPCALLLPPSPGAPNLGPSMFLRFESCAALDAASQGDYYGTGYSYYRTAWQGLEEYGCCDQLSADRRSCRRNNGRMFVSGGLPEAMPMQSADSSSKSGPASATAGGSAAGPATSFSSTNNQVLNVDEPDIVKNDGVCQRWQHQQHHTTTPPLVCGSPACTPFTPWLPPCMRNPAAQYISTGVFPFSE